MVYGELSERWLSERLLRVVGLSLGSMTLMGLVVLGGGSPVFAHALETNYAFDLLQSELDFTSTFSTGEPLGQGVVKIYAPGDRETPWIELTTDDQGRFAFHPDLNQPGEWRIEIEEGGHGDIWTVPVTAAGVEFDGISEAGHQDIHYGEVSHTMGWIAGVGGAFFGVLVYQVRKTWHTWGF